MKFPTFREYRPFQGTIAEVIKYLSVDLVYTLKQLTLGLTKLSFEDNFSGWIEDLTIGAGEEVAIANRLGEIPTCRIICRGGNGAQNIVDGVNEWTTEQVYLRNVGTTAVTIKVSFLK